MKKAVLIAGAFLAYIVLFTLFVVIYFGGVSDEKSQLGTSISPEQGSSLRKISVSTCSGDGDLFLYEGDNPFQPIATSFEAEGTEVLIFTNQGDDIDSFDFKVGGNKVSPNKITDQVFSLSVSYGSEISADGTYEDGARGLQGFLVQDADNPVYASDFQYINGDKRSDDMYLNPGSYHYVFLDKYTINAPGEGVDERLLNVKVDGSDGSNVVDETYDSPYPSGVQGAVVGSFNISEGGMYTLSVDSEDSVYWALVECPVCGDGNEEEGEECDNGQENGIECTPPYGGECEYCSDVCEKEIIEGPSCGDGDVNGDEKCDAGGSNGEVCTPNYGDKCEYCSYDCDTVVVGGPYCGDGKVDQNNGEECDGEVGVGDYQSCSNNCKLIDIPHCGDGKEDEGEECDDGNIVDGDGCSSSCQMPDECSEACTSDIGCDGGLGCFDGMCRNEDCSLESDCICASCGDGKIDKGEECDDGNNKNGDGCSSRCMKEEKEEKEDDDCDGSIGNYIWEDVNGDGVQDDNEAGIAGVKVCAHNGNDKDCDKTNSSGRYKIEDLCEGDYDVRVRSTDLAEFYPTYDPDGKLDHKTDVELDGDNDHHTKADFGYRKKKVAPAAGVNVPALMMIAVVITAVVLIAHELIRKRKARK